MTQFNLHEAKASFSSVARRVRAGETIILCDRNKPFAEIRPLAGIAPKRPKRRLGQLAGVCIVPSDFNAPDPTFEDVLHHGPIFPTVGPAHAATDQP
jgi:antitoxin (DNA-binding transcriptional repressor) of toxin-antitoxin stability system